MDINIANMLLLRCNTGRPFFTLSDVNDNMTDDGPFSNGKKAIQQFIRDGLVRKTGEERYEITADIFTLRKYILAAIAAERQQENVARPEIRFNLGYVASCVWRLKGVVEDAEEDDDMLNRMRFEYLEKRRREFESRYGHARGEDSENNDNDDEDEDDEDDSDEDNSDDDDDFEIPDPDEIPDSDDDDYEDDEMAEFRKLRESIRKNREQLEARRRELINQLFSDFNGNEDGNAELKDSAAEKSEAVEDVNTSDEGAVRCKIMSVLTDSGAEGKLRAEALKVCVREGMASSAIISGELNITRAAADKLRIWLAVNGFISPRSRKDGTFGLTLDEKLFYSCCEELNARREAQGRLARAIAAVAAKKSRPEECGKAPSWSLWESRSEFEEAVHARLVALIRSDFKITRAKAVERAETYLIAVRDTHDGKMAQVYERLVYELRNMSTYKYNNLKKRLSG